MTDIKCLLFRIVVWLCEEFLAFRENPWKHGISSESLLGLGSGANLNVAQCLAHWGRLRFRAAGGAIRPKEK